MNKHLFLIFLCFLPLYICVNTGIKVALNDRLIQTMKKHFSPEINKMMTKIKIGDFHIFLNFYGDDVWLHFPSNFMDYFKVQLSNNMISVKCNGLTAKADGDIRISFWLFSLYKSLSITASNFRMDAKFKIVNQPLEGGGYKPTLEMVGDPNVDASIHVSSSGIIGAVVSALANLILPLFKRSIINLGVGEGKKYLYNILNNFKMEACIDTHNNLWIDYSLINPVKWSSNFIELNTYGLVYNKNKPDTQKNKNGISFSDLPYLTNMNNQLQIYVSEYSINSAAKTFINTFSKTIEFKADANILDSFLHGFKNVFPDPTGDVLLSPKGLPQIQITNKGLSVKYPHYITVWAWSRKSKPAFHGIIELNLEIDLAVEKGPTIYANIKDLSAKVVRIDVNDVNSNPNTAIEGTFKILKDTVIGLFNELAKNMKYKFPTVMGLNFTDLKLEFKNNHILINYNLS